MMKALNDKWILLAVFVLMLCGFRYAIIHQAPRDEAAIARDDDGMVDRGDADPTFYDISNSGAAISTGGTGVVLPFTSGTCWSNTTSSSGITCSSAGSSIPGTIIVTYGAGGGGGGGSTQ